MNTIQRNHLVPLFGKEGLGEILLDKAKVLLDNSPFLKGGGERLQCNSKAL